MTQELEGVGYEGCIPISPLRPFDREDGFTEIGVLSDSSHAA